MTLRKVPRARFILGIAAAMLSVSVLVAACGGGSSKTTSNTPTVAAAARGAGATATPAAVTRIAPSSSSDKTGLTLGTKQLTQYADTTCDFSPAVSRDGSHVTFVRATRKDASQSCPKAGTVEVLSADGSGLTDLGAGVQPFFSADGANVGFFNTPDASGCLPGVTIVSVAAAPVAKIAGSFAAAEANDPLSPDGKSLVLKACTGGATVVVGMDGAPGPALTFPAELQLGPTPTVSPFGWTPTGKAVVINAAAKFLLVDPASGTVSAAPGGSVAFIQARTPWEFQLDLWNPSLPLQFQ